MFPVSGLKLAETQDYTGTVTKSSKTDGYKVHKILPTVLEQLDTVHVQDTVSILRLTSHYMN